MTIKQLAEQLGVSTMTVYRRCKDNGVDVANLRDENTKELTAAGASVIASFFRNNSVTLEEQTVQQTVTRDAQRDATDITDSDAVTVAVLRAQLDAARDTIARLESERDRLVTQLDAVTAALHAEQADRQSERLLLTAGGADDGKRGFLWRLFRR